MTTKKKAQPAKAVAPKKPAKGTEDATPPKPGPRPQRSAVYETAVREFAVALHLLQKGDAAAALKGFEAIEAHAGEEPALAERARTYARIARRKLGSEAPAPTTPLAQYQLAVVRSNEGRLEDALGLIEKALALEPANASFLYLRASVRALQGNGDAAASDLQRAVSLEPALRFHAANDPDFERVRDEAAFIDVIEPTPTGA